MDDTISPVIAGSGDIDFKAELLRKGIHICSLSIPIIYNFVSRETMLMLLIPATLAFLAVDVLRYFHVSTARLFYLIFGKLLRQHEVNSKTRTLNGATYVLLSATLCVLFFPKVIVITSFAILIISDSAAALFGRRFGKHRFYHKSIEGSTAFVISAIIVVLVAPKVSYLPAEYLIGIIGAVVGAVAEILSYNILDDNIAIPLSVGSVMWLLYTWLLPFLNLH